MKNLDSVFWAYILGWAIFFVFYLSIAKRSNDLRAEVERMKRSASGTASGKVQEK